MLYDVRDHEAYDRAHDFVVSERVSLNKFWFVNKFCVKDVTVAIRMIQVPQRQWTEACLIAKNNNVIFKRDSGRAIPPSYELIIKNFL